MAGGVAVPKDLGIPEVGEFGWHVQHGIRFVLRPRAASVGACCHALHLTVGSGLGEEGDHRLRTEFGSIVPIDDRTPREDGPQLIIRAEGNRKMFPVNEIGAHRVAPMHRTPPRTFRVVLKEKVILTLVEHQPVGVVEPVLLRGEVEARAQTGTRVEPGHNYQQARPNKAGIATIKDNRLPRRNPVCRSVCNYPARTVASNDLAGCLVEVAGSGGVDAHVDLVAQTGA